MNTNVSKEDKSDIENKVLCFAKELRDYSDIDCKYFKNKEDHFWDIVIRTGHDYYHARSHDSTAISSIDKALAIIKNKIAS